MYTVTTTVIPGIQLTIGVHIPSKSGDDGARKKRDVGYQPLRMFIHYDDSVNTE